MVRVYIARIPGENQNYTQQSKGAYRLLEQALLREHPEISAPVCVEKDSCGKPFSPGYPQIHISISHSGGFAACAIGEKPVGVDLEMWKTRKNPGKIVGKFHVREQEAYKKAIDAEEEGEAGQGIAGGLVVQEAFYNLWVLKESFLKAEGRGIRIPLDTFCVLGGNKILGAAGFFGPVEQSLNEQEYFCRLYAVGDKGLSLAVCSEEKEMEEQAVWLTLPKEFSQTK